VWQAGGRLGEVLGADWPDIALERRAWWIRNGKGGRTRWVPLSALALEQLRSLWDVQGRPEKGPVLLSRTRRRLSKTSLWNTIKGLRRAAGVPKASPHWFRHTYVTRLAERAASPADLRKIQKLAGHASLEMTQVYLHVPEADRGLVDQAFGPVG
jgi:integrase